MWLEVCMFNFKNISYISMSLKVFKIYIVYPAETLKYILSTVYWPLLILKYS